MTAPHDDSPVEKALNGGTLQAVGWYRFYFADERWEWSAEVAQIHGYQPGTVTPTTQLVLSHKHPDDYKYIAATLDDIRRTHKPLSTATASSPSKAKPATSSSSVNGCTTTTPAKEQLSIPVDQDLLRGVLRGRFVVGAFDEFAVLESSAGADQCHQVGCVDRAPA